MPETVNTEFENENGYIRYPFSKEAVLVDTAGNELSDECILDAVLYPRSGKYRLASIYKSNDGSKTLIRLVTDTSERATGEIVDGSKTVELYDDDGFHRGTLLVGEKIRELVDDPVDHDYQLAWFSGSCQFELGSTSVDSLYIDGQKINGDVTFVHGGGKVAIKPVVTDNDDGSHNLRFDVVPLSSITDLSNTGIRKIFVLRQPSSMFNVLERDGYPYLYVVRPGNSASKIGRDFICSYKNDKKAGGSYKEVSYSEDCGNKSKASSSASGTCFPTRANLNEFAKMYDPETRELKDGDVSFGYSYGFKYIPVMNGFKAPSSMCTMFIEGELFVSMQAYNYGVLAVFNEYRTGAANSLFYASTRSGISDSFSIPLKNTAYRTFFDYVFANRLGGLGFIDKDALVRLCKEQGWYATYEDLAYPDDVDPFQFTYDLKNSINDANLAKYRSIYINRARDFFEHFECLNWEVSSSEQLGDEVRWLVGWDTGQLLFSGGNSYVTITGENDEKAKIPAWMVSRYVWWKRLSKNGRNVRHFIVPKDRGLTIYTGSYYTDDDNPVKKELSPASWLCDIPLLVWCGYVDDIGVFAYMSNKWMDSSVMAKMRERLHMEYPDDYDPTHGDVSFKYSALSTGAPIEVSVENSLDSLEDAARRFDNRVTSDTLTALPADTPIYTDDSDEEIRTIGKSWPGPFEFKYDKVYIPGVGFDDGDTTEAIRAPVSFSFDIASAATVNSFNIDVTDITAVGMVYKNPIHISLLEGTAAPNTLNIKNPTDTNAVSDEMTNLTKQKTTGNGIEISIPGIGG